MTTARKIIEDAAQKISVNRDAARQVGAAYKFVITGDGGGTFMVDLTENPSIREADEAAPCTIKVTATDFVELMEGKVPPQNLFFAGKLQIEGDVLLAMKLQALPQILAT